MVTRRYRDCNSDAPVVRTPGLNRFLDIRPRKLFGERPLGQLSDLYIGCEAQGEELAFSEFRNARPRRLGQKRSQPQTLLQTNHAVLHAERVQPDLEHSDGSGSNENGPPRRVQTGVPQEQDDGRGVESPKTGRTKK